MKFIYKVIILIIFSLIFTNLVNAETIDDIEYKKSIKVWETIKIDLSEYIKKIEEEYETDIYVERDTRDDVTKEWEIFEKSFDNFWEKTIIVRIYKTLENWEKNIIINREYEIFVYREKVSVLIDKDIEKKEITDYSNAWELEWVYLDIRLLNSKNLWNGNISSILKDSDTETNENKYIWIWWSKEFLFDVLSEINKESQNSNIESKLNILLISNFNIYVLQNYLNNFLANKEWINKILLIENISKNQVFRNPDNIIELKEELKNNWYNYLDINIEKKINEFMFISKFINNLSWKWLSTDWIYILIIIPFLLIWVSFFKHLIWFSLLGVIIPISSTILFFKFWITISILFLVTLLAINMTISKLINDYNLLYTPKISFIAIINIIIFILLINVLFKYWIIDTNINDLIFILLFIIISERFITIIIWKEFREYKSNFFYTIVFSLVSFWFFSINIVKVFILAYPEIIIILVPIAFLMWKFTWLRMTEYFRFKEVINKIEE